MLGYWVLRQFYLVRQQYSRWHWSLNYSKCISMMRMASCAYASRSDEILLMTFACRCGWWGYIFRKISDYISGHFAFWTRNISCEWDSLSWIYAELLRWTLAQGGLQSFQLTVGCRIFWKQNWYNFMQFQILDILMLRVLALYSQGNSNTYQPGTSLHYQYCSEGIGVVPHDYSDHWGYGQARNSVVQHYCSRQ